LNGIQPDEIQDISINQQSIYGYTKEGVDNGHVIFETDGISTTLDYDLSDRNFFEDGDSPLLGIVLKSGDVLYKNVIISGQAKCPICPVVSWVWSFRARAWIATRVGTLYARGRITTIASWPWIKKHGVLSHNKCKKITKGFNHVLEAHHIIEDRFRKALSQKTGKMLCVVLTWGDHQAVSAWWRTELPTGQTYDKAQVLAAFKKVYKDYPPILELEKILFNPH
jgi:hypothetical protein